MGSSYTETFYTLSFDDDRETFARKLGAVHELEARRAADPEVQRLVKIRDLLDEVTRRARRRGRGRAAG